MFIPTTIVIIQELDVTWAQMEFDHNPHPTAGVKMIGARNELIETLEDNQVKLRTCNHTKRSTYKQVHNCSSDFSNVVCP